MTKLRFMMAAASLSTMLFSCSKKDNNVSTTTTAGYTSVQDVYKALALSPKITNIDATTGGSVYGNSGTRYVFTGGSFMYASGATVTGLIDLQLTEYLKKGDMLFSKIIPVSNGEPLLSGGEVNVVATQGGTPVCLKPGYTFQANIPTVGTPPTGMSLFKGQPSTDTTLSKVNWTKAIDSGGHGNGGVVIVTGQDTLQLFSDSIKFANADQFMTSPNYQTFTITVTATGATVPAAGVSGYALYDNYKGVWGLSSYSDGHFNEYHVPNIPVHFVVFTVISGKFYAGVLGVTPATGSTYTVNLTEQDPVTFKAAVNNL